MWQSQCPVNVSFKGMNLTRNLLIMKQGNQVIIVVGFFPLRAMVLRP